MNCPGKNARERRLGENSIATMMKTTVVRAAGLDRSAGALSLPQPRRRPPTLLAQPAHRALRAALANEARARDDNTVRRAAPRGRRMADPAKSQNSEATAAASHAATAAITAPQRAALYDSFGPLAGAFRGFGSKLKMKDCG